MQDKGNGIHSLAKPAANNGAAYKTGSKDLLMKRKNLFANGNILFHARKLTFHNEKRSNKVS
jgi:hypothetical protein